jgi:hypothetical protein
MAVAIFVNEVKGKSILALSRDLGCQYKIAFCLAHKFREALASEVRQTAIGGEGKRAEVDEMGPNRNRRSPGRNGRNLGQVG